MVKTKNQFWFHRWLNSLRPSDGYMSVKDANIASDNGLLHVWAKPYSQQFYCLLRCDLYWRFDGSLDLMTPSHYLSQCWLRSCGIHMKAISQEVHKYINLWKQFEKCTFEITPTSSTGQWVNYTPASTKLKGGILVSSFPSVCMFVFGQNRVRSVSSTILVESISYLHILSSNFRRCVACKVCYKIKKLENLAISWNL